MTCVGTVGKLSLGDSAYTIERSIPSPPPLQNEGSGLGLIYVLERKTCVERLGRGATAAGALVV